MKNKKSNSCILWYASDHKNVLLRDGKKGGWQKTAFPHGTV